MLTQRGDFYLRKDFGFVDLGFAAVMTPSVISVYEIIRRYTWRGTTKNPEVARLKREGKLPARVGQATIAALTGLGRSTVWGKINKLKEYGWLQTSTVSNGKSGTEVVYVLGENLVDAQGGKHEVFYADSVCQEVQQMVVAEIKKREDTAVSEGHDSDEYWVRAVSAEERVELTRQALGWVVKKLNGGCSDSEGGLSKNGMGVVRNLNTEVDNQSRDPKVEKQEAGVAALPACPEGALAFFAGHENQRRTVPRDLDEDPEESPKSPTPPDPGDLSDPPPPDDEAAKDDDGPAKGRSVAERLPYLDRLAAQAAENSRRRAQAKQDGVRAREQRQENLQGGKEPPATRKQLKLLEATWRDGMIDMFPDVSTSKWAGKERGQTMKLIELHGFEIAKLGLEYVQLEWDAVQRRFLKGKGSFPSVGLLLRFHDVLCLEAQKWAKLRVDLEEGKRWFRDNPDELYPPDDLDRRYTAAQEAYKAMVGE